MQPLVNGEPADGESWQELADHAFTHDDVSPAGWARTEGLVALPATREDIPAALAALAELDREIRARRRLLAGA